MRSEERRPFLPFCLRFSKRHPALSLARSATKSPALLHNTNVRLSNALGWLTATEETVEKLTYATLLPIFGRSQGAKRRS